MYHQYTDSSLLGLIDLATVMERKLAVVLNAFDLSTAELRVLGVCIAHPHSTAVMIARLVPIDTPSISRLVHRLVQKGLLERERSTKDRRQVFLTVTDEGEDRLRRLQTVLQESERDFFSGLREEQRLCFTESFTTLVNENFPLR